MAFIADDNMTNSFRNMPPPGAASPQRVQVQAKRKILAPPTQGYPGSGVNFAPAPPAVMQGGQPTMGAYQKPIQAAAVAQMDPAMQSQVHARALTYARARLNQLRRVMAVLPPELQQLMMQQGQANTADPAAAWRNISGAFANASKQAGFVDPRYYLRHELPNQMQAKGLQ